MEAKVFTYKDGFIIEKPSDITLGFFENYELKSYAYPIKLENGTEVIEGKDFELQFQFLTIPDIKHVWKNCTEEQYNLTDKKYRRIIAIPLTPAPKMSKEEIPPAQKLLVENHYNLWCTLQRYGFASELLIVMQEYSDSRVKELEKEIERRNQLIKMFWCREHPHNSFAGHTDGEMFKHQEYIWQKYAANNNL